VLAWIGAARSLAVEFAEVTEAQEQAKKDEEGGTEMTPKPA
jgi:hypothetical protein